MRQTLTDNFWGIHKNINCAFPLRTSLVNVNKSIENLNEQLLREFLTEKLFLCSAVVKKSVVYRSCFGQPIVHFLKYQ